MTSSFLRTLAATASVALSTLVFVPVVSGQIAGPLRVHQTNRRYFTDNSGKAIYLTGSHYWNVFQDRGDNDPPPAFDYTSYLDFLQSHNHNFLRLWVWEQPRWAAFQEGDHFFAPMPFARTGPGAALDGKPKFNLTQFNQPYFDRLRARVVAARDRGIYVAIMLFQGWSVEPKMGGTGPWPGHPFNASNNVNGVNGDPNGDNNGIESHTLQVAAVTARQEAYVRKVIDTVNDLDNVLYEISNESAPGSTQWQYHFINFIKQYEASKPKQHPVGMTYQFAGGSNSALFNSPADWISPNGDDGYMDNPPAATGAKVIIVDTDHLWGVGGDGQWVWQTFMRGLHPIYMDPYGEPDDPPADESARQAMGHTLAYATRINLATMTPRNTLTSTNYCLANPGSEYLVYQPAGGSLTVNLSAASGTVTVEWFNPADGTTAAGTAVNGGATRTFNPPFGGQAVLYLRAGSTTVPPPAAPSNVRIIR